MPIVIREKLLIVAAGTLPVPSDETLNMHRDVLNRFLINNPLVIANAQVDNNNVRVSWRRFHDGKVEAVILLTITDINAAALGLPFLESAESQWIAADFSNQAHYDLVANLDLDQWVSLNNTRTHAWFRDAQLRRAESEAANAVAPMASVPPSNQTIDFVFALEASNHETSERILRTHCRVLQAYALEQPLVCDGAQIDPSSVKIGWRRLESGQVQLILRVRITRLDTILLAAVPNDSMGDENWVAANFDLPEHCAMADRLDVHTWLRAQDQRTRQWIYAATLDNAHDPDVVVAAASLLSMTLEESSAPAGDAQAATGGSASDASDTSNNGPGLFSAQPGAGGGGAAVNSSQHEVVSEGLRRRQDRGHNLG